MEKSAWFTPEHCDVEIVYCIFIVCGSRNSSCFNASATTIADLPSGVKYRLYASGTLMVVPGFPVLGSIGVKMPESFLSALPAIHSVFKSHEGITCWGLPPMTK